VVLVMNISFVILVVSYLVGLVSILIFLILYIRRSKAVASGNSEELRRTIPKFMAAKPNDKSGKLFVRLIDLGFFSTSKINNHGKDFDDKRHLKNFQMNLTPEISDALWQVRGGE